MIADDLVTSARCSALRCCRCCVSLRLCCLLLYLLELELEGRILETKLLDHDLELLLVIGRRELLRRASRWA